MTETAKARAISFLKKHSIKVVDYNSLCEAAEKSGFSIIEFSNAYNDEDVSVIIKELGLENAVLCSKGFTYADRNYRLIFVNENLSENEKCMVLSHELGHIECGHITEKNVFGNDVRQEHEANEFSHYILKRTGRRCSFWKKHKKAVICASVVAVVALSVALVLLLSSGSDEYYVTATGWRYHTENCKYVKHKTDAEKVSWEEIQEGGYRRCTVCMPEA